MKVWRGKAVRIEAAEDPDQRWQNAVSRYQRDEAMHVSIRGLRDVLLAMEPPPVPPPYPDAVLLALANMASPPPLDDSAFTFPTLAAEGGQEHGKGRKVRGHRQASRR